MMGFSSSWPARSFVGRLTQAEREVLMGLGMRYMLQAGRLVIAQGEQSRHVVILQSGFVKVTTTTPGHQEALMAVRGPGDIIGELAAMSGAERCATVTTCGRIVGRLISQRVFEQFLSDHPAVSRHLTSVVGDKLLWANRRRTDFVSLPARSRVASVLRDLALVFSSPGTSNGPVGINVTQPELASMAGIREVTVHKELRELRDLKAISTGYRRIVILDPDLLRELCELPADESDADK